MENKDAQRFTRLIMKWNLSLSLSLSLFLPWIVQMWLVWKVTKRPEPGRLPLVD